MADFPAEVLALQPDLLVSGNTMELACFLVPASVVVSCGGSIRLTLPHVMQDSAIVTATSTSCDPDISFAAARLLLSILRGLKRSLARASDTLLAPPPEGRAQPPMLAAAGLPAGTMPSLGSPPRLRLGTVEGADVAVAVATAAAASQQSRLALGGHSGERAGQQQAFHYPQPLPTIPEHVACHGTELRQYMESQGLLNVSALATALALQLLPSLSNPQAHWRMLPLLEELLPLLLGTRSEAVPTVATKGLQLRIALLLQPLAQALLANLCMARAGSAGIVQVCGTYRLLVAQACTSQPLNIDGW